MRDANGVIQRAPDATTLPSEERPRPPLDADVIFDALLRGAGDRFSPHCSGELRLKLVEVVRECRFTEADLVTLGADLRRHMPPWVKSGIVDAVVLLGRQRDGAPLLSLMSEAKQRVEQNRAKRDAIADAVERRRVRGGEPVALGDAYREGIARAKAAGRAGGGA